MRSQVMALALSLIVLQPHASADLGHSAGKLNEILRDTAGPKTDCVGCAQAGLPPSPSAKLMEKCVDQICPDKKHSLAATLDEIVKTDPDSDPAYKANLKPALEELARKQIENYLAIIKDHAEWLEGNPQINNPAAMEVFNFNFATQAMERMKIEFKWESYSYEVNRELSRPLFPNLDEKMFDMSVKVANYALKMRTSTGLPEDLNTLHVVYPGEKLTQKFNELLAETEVSVQRMLKSESFGPAFKDLGMKSLEETSYVQRFRAGAPTADDLSSFKNDYVTLKLMNHAITNPELKSIIAGKSFNPKDFAARTGVLENIRKSVTQYEANLKNKDYLRSSVVEKCAAAFVQSQKLLPTQKQIDELKAREPQLRERFKSKVLSMLSGESAKSVRPQVDQWRFIFPQSREESAKQYSELISEAKNGMDESIRARPNLQKSSSRDTFQLLALLGQYVSDGKPPALGEGLADSCKKLLPEPVPDAAYTSHSGIVIGPLACSSGHKGDGILFHEMGHMLFDTLRKANLSLHTAGWFSRVRSCLDSNHNERPQQEMQSVRYYQDGEFGSLYESEDFADMAGELASESSGLFGCFLMRKTKTADYAETGLRNAISSDVHSGELFRVLHMQATAGEKVPEDCKRALAQRNESPSIRDCRDPEATSNLPIPPTFMKGAPKGLPVEASPYYQYR